MKEHPILFSTQMVQAILEGRKTQTRRIIKPQPIIDQDSGFVFDGRHTQQYDLHNWRYQFVDDFSRWMPEDRLWVREKTGDYQNRMFDLPPVYRTEIPDDRAGFYKWHPSIHMKKQYARIWLEVTDIRVELIQEISEADAIAEGISPEVTGDYLFENYNKVGYRWIKAKESYRSLWESINGKESWEVNPWVWVIDFNVLSTSGKPK